MTGKKGKLRLDLETITQVKLIHTDTGPVVYLQSHDGEIQVLAGLPQRCIDCLCRLIYELVKHHYDARARWVKGPWNLQVTANWWEAQARWWEPELWE